MGKSLRLSLLTASLLLGFGCSSVQYYFAPKEETPLTPRGQLGATFAVPEGQSQSYVRIFPTEVRKVRGQRVLPVRYYLENTDLSAWHLDATHQKLKIPGGGPEVVAMISDEPSQSSLTEVPKRKSRVWDIVFPLPDSIQSSADLPSFDLSWEVQVQPKTVTGTATFVPAVLPEKSVSGNALPPPRGAHH